MTQAFYAHMNNKTIKIKKNPKKQDTSTPHDSQQYHKTIPNVGEDVWQLEPGW
jgi:hypothetical protein